MGTTQSIPYNVENPRRRLKDLRCWPKFNAELQKYNSNYEQEIVGNMTAPEVQWFRFYLTMDGIEIPFIDINTPDTLSSKWKPWFCILNKCSEPIRIELWKKYPTHTLESELINIPPDTIGRFPLPEKVDFTCHYPLYTILNGRFIRIFFEDGEVQKIDCGLLNDGIYRMDFVVEFDRTVSVCDYIEPQTRDEENPLYLEYIEFISETSDPNCPELTVEQRRQIDMLWKRCFKQPVKSE